MPTLQRTRLHQKSLHAVRAHAAGRALDRRIADVSKWVSMPQFSLGVWPALR